MSDLISRQKALDGLKYEMKYGAEIDRCGLDTAYDIIENLPSVESERKIIHCKDCKFYTPMNRKLKTGICSLTMHHLGDDGFCSDAEKRGNR